MLSVEEKQQISSAAALFKLLSHPVRVQILDLLTRGPQSVSEIASELALSQSSVSKHLSQMRDADIISMERQGVQMICSVRMKCAETLLACAKDPQSAPSSGVVPVPFRPGCE